MTLRRVALLERPGDESVESKYRRLTETMFIEMRADPSLAELGCEQIRRAIRAHLLSHELFAGIKDELVEFVAGERFEMALCPDGVMRIVENDE